MTEAKARTLLKEASREGDRLRRHLLVAAALSEVLSTEPTVVGGTAEEYWARAEYHETDLDLCAPLSTSDVRALARMGFQKEGRHWFREDVRVAVEFPSSTIDGDPGRTVVEPIGTGRARLIGIDDLYLDRVRQATVAEDIDDVSFVSALAIAAARFNSMDWRYVRSRLKAIRETEPDTAAAMTRIDRRVRRTVLQERRRPLET